MKTIIVDLDGTLADVTHRLHHIHAGKKKDWKAFFAAMPLDPVNEWCRVLLSVMRQAGYRIAIVTGRPDSYMQAIERWLQEGGIQYDALYARAEGDFRPDTIVKREIFRAHFTKEDILFVLDDRPAVVDMWRREGLICLQCEPHDV